LGAGVSVFYTRVPTQWSPAGIYRLSEEVILRPAGRTYIQRGFSRLYLDSVYFMTYGLSIDQHAIALRSWMQFHDFLFWSSPSLLSEYELGKLSKHGGPRFLEDIAVYAEENAYVIDYDNIAAQIYWTHNTNAAVSYKYAFSVFSHIEKPLRDLVSLWLYPFNRGIDNLWLQILDSSYLNISSKIVILESIIGHSRNCPSLPKCESCGKSLPHRLIPESIWRRNILKSKIDDIEIVEQYNMTLELAYRTIRNQVFHAGLFPEALEPVMPEYEEEYDFKRMIDEYESDSVALSGLTMNVSRIARCFLLDKIFGWGQFPRLPILHVVRIGSGASPVAQRDDSSD